MQGNHAYEKLESNAQQHSEIKDLEFHSRSKILLIDTVACKEIRFLLTFENLA